MSKCLLCERTFSDVLKPCPYQPEFCASCYMIEDAVVIARLLNEKSAKEQPDE